jgi:capsular exopolysaccharide synthesis family protein
VAPAQVPANPASPDVPLILVAAVVAGLLLGGALAWLREAMDTRVRDTDVLAMVTDRPLIGTVATWSARTRNPLVVAAAPYSSQSESFRQLRTNLQFLRVADEPLAGAHVLSITSSLAGEGKSTVSSNLALALAQTGARVLLVDADLRRPTIAGLLGVEGSVGLTTVLAGQAPLADVVQPWGEEGLHVLPSGALPPNPAELLGSPVMSRLVEQMRERYDYVVFDSAPLLPVADAVVLSRLVDGTVLVVQAGRVRTGQVAQALSNLDQVSAPVLGLVVNRVRRDGGTYDYEGREPAGRDRAGARRSGQGAERDDRMPVA